MMLKRIATWFLLCFVAATVGKLVYDAVAVQKQGETPSAAAAEAARDRVIAYFLHTEVRCWNCDTIEKFAHAALTEGFAVPLDSGDLEWRVLSMDEPANGHLAVEFELITSSVVLARMEGGKHRDWKNLSRVWDLVHDEQEFKTYVAQATQAFLVEQP